MATSRTRLFLPVCLAVVVLVSGITLKAEVRPIQTGGFVVTHELLLPGSEVAEGWSDAVDRAWHHFLFERLKPYVESGRHRGAVTKPQEVPSLKPK